jgi:hypothetical protein
MDFFVTVCFFCFCVHLYKQKTTVEKLKGLAGDQVFQLGNLHLSFAESSCDLQLTKFEDSLSCFTNKRLQLCKIDNEPEKLSKKDVS